MPKSPDNTEKLKSLLEKADCTICELQSFYVRMAGMGATLGELQEIKYKIQSIGEVENDKNKSTF